MQIGKHRICILHSLIEHDIKMLVNTRLFFIKFVSVAIMEIMSCLSSKEKSTIKVLRVFHELSYLNDFAFPRYISVDQI